MCDLSHVPPVGYTGYQLDKGDAYFFKLNESVAEGLSSFPVSDDLTAAHNKTAVKLCQAKVN